jgi:hypothetical protein
MISLHLFNLLFLRYPSTKAGFWMTIIVGWSVLITIVVIGPLAIETKEQGPYFGISGTWCVTTLILTTPIIKMFFQVLDNSTIPQGAGILGVLLGELQRSPNGMVIDPLLCQEFLSAGLGFLLYTAVVLRLRGNLLFSEGKWHLRFVPRGQSWQLSFVRDLLDSLMLHVAQNMVW